MTNISKSILLAGVILMAFLCMIGTAAAAEEIASWSDFDKIRADLNGDFTLTVDLDFSEAPEGYWEPLGTSSIPFTGTFDGDIYTISNLVLTEESYDNGAGFFGYTRNAELKNIKLENVEVTIDSPADVSKIGLLAGNFSGTIENCHVDGEIIVSNDGSIDNVGGLVGYIGDAEITDSSADVSIEIASYSKISGIGGLVGATWDGAITNSYAAGDITIEAAGDEVIEIGGLVGFNIGDVTNSYATGNITIETAADQVGEIGGLVGMNEEGSITNSYTTGSIKITSESDVSTVGGLVGTNFDNIENCYALNKEIIVNNEGGFIGKAIGYSREEAADVFAWNNMEGEFTNDPDESDPITSDEVWDKIDWIGDDSTWKVNEDPDFKLPIFVWQEEPLVGDANHLTKGDIYVWSDFDKVRQNPGEKFNLRADLDFTAAEEEYWTPLGTEDAPFTGTFDGNGFVISNLILNEESYDENTGFFGFAQGATLKDITLEDVVLTIGNENEPYADDVLIVGLLTSALLGGTIENCYATGNIEITSESDVGVIGRLVGMNWGGDITNSYATGNIKITSESGVGIIGGLVGINVNEVGEGTITNSYAAGNIEITTDGDVQIIGGLVGSNGFEEEMDGGAITNSYAIGDVTITTDGEIYHVGGLIGFNNAVITNSYATGDVVVVDSENVYCIGGLTGYNEGEMTSSYATGDVTITTDGEIYHTGGLIGFNNAVITNSYATGDITIETAGIDNVGGLVGCNLDNIANSYATGSIKITAEYVVEDGDVGGLVGENYGDIDNCYALNKEIILSGASSEYIGKAVGYSDGGEITNVRAWNGMRGEFTSEFDEPEPITSAEVWNKIDWIDDGESWKLNTYRDFKLPVFVWQEEPFVADASHLNPSPPSSNRGGGSGTGSATVVNSTTNTSTNEGFGEEIDNGSSDAGDSGSSGGDDGSDNGDSGDSSESGPNWTVIILVVAAVVVVAIAAGLYLNKTGKLKF